MEDVIDKETRWFIRFFCTRNRSKQDSTFYKEAKDFFNGFDESFKDDKFKMVEALLPTPSLPTTKRKVILPSDRMK